MIEKLKVVMKPEDWKLPVNELEMRCLKNLLLKVDELVDAVNELEKTAENWKCSKMENVDHYSEQCKWIGKLCRFWDDGCVSDYISLLKQIDDDDTPFVDDKNVCWQHCEPVSPDDDIIYKKEQKD